ncbi:hypothetical protein ACNF40_01200 [Cuniculiplasma sp. SKW4]|uniref:hypothetical protein n=1 Tax=Cuniculiplasma sp. SKW4 TaxID=3400171 RepID=UPI003FD07B94
MNFSRRNGYNISQAENRTTVIVSITNSTYTINDYSQYTNEYRDKWLETVYYTEVNGHYLINRVLRTEVGSTLVSSTWDGNGTYVSISYIKTNTKDNNLNIVVENVPNYIAYGISYILGSKSASIKHYDLNTSGKSSSLSSTSMEYDFSGYVNASNVISELHDALGIFSASLGMGLAVIEIEASANDVDFDTGEVAIAMQAAKLIDSEVGLTSSILGAISSIAFYSTDEAVDIGYSLSNDPLAYVNGSSGSGYVLSVPGTSQPMTLNINGNAYTFNAPEDYINATSIIT